jgi:arsenite-transporting ATPase
MPYPHPALHLVSADLPGLACALVAAEQEHAAAEAPVILDLTGEAWLEGHLPQASLISYGAIHYGLSLWEQLQPRLDPWLELLELKQVEPLLAPPLPGLDMLLRCLCLAEAHARHPQLTVLLPAPSEAAALLELACTGPALVEGLLEPLLLWWDQTRQSLSSLELVLRLRLPSSVGLRLDDTWRGHLQRLAEALRAEQGAWQFSVVLDQADGAAELLRRRVGAMALRGFIPTRLGLHGSAASALLASRPAWLPQDLPAVPLDEQGIAALLALEAAAPTAADAEDQLVLPLPGVLKEELDLQQIGSTLVLRVRGHRRLLSMPERLQGKTCSGARLEGGRLELRFG